jgi:hypothetical protein
MLFLTKRFKLLSKMEKICVNKFTRKTANQRPSSVWVYLTKHFTNSSQKWTIICASSLQVLCQFYKCVCNDLQVGLQFALK